MQNSNRLGVKGERLAQKYLKGNLWHILENNYRHGPHEIDIIAQLDELLIFVEVKARSSDRYGFPEHMISLRQINSIRTAAEEYLFHVAWSGRIRFDVISIEWSAGSYRLWHIEDAF